MMFIPFLTAIETALKKNPSKSFVYNERKRKRKRERIS